ncbi:hypothetical protein TVAG_292540 [Trichomonas vaginalis G3]|uniref:Uncharacterized protein n=1 Tax=Trichomonas vaginalis (strain ATCC PRA-98 / G3) TaxID=412133 RepID=A2F0C6_TRIV3|nr:hypothetical protein TVAGG3_0216400 [Trichomonas vaginalis G3]EAY01621.1 hypothetical protein TVAG_292540 [Trichomonas vaginalis G3]KAI5551586.1 hypothetical protein TVAGG3_0216400 [Trichomonas vaginalis G3]|eukprot:XP_001314238.1 hypothetical protein [Trichomonas vaginalis G3]
MTEITLTLCSDYLPKAYLTHPTLTTVLPRKMWIYFIENTTGEPSDTFSEIWVYASKEAYEKDQEHVVLKEMSLGLGANGVKDGNLLLFKTRNESA